jgi:hypothetical protein
MLCKQYWFSSALVSIVSWLLCATSTMRTTVYKSTLLLQLQLTRLLLMLVLPVLTSTCSSCTTSCLLIATLTISMYYSLLPLHDGRYFRGHVTSFAYAREEVETVLKDYRDPTGRVMKTQQLVLFRRCGCVDEQGEQLPALLLLFSTNSCVCV